LVAGHLDDVYAEPEIIEDADRGIWVPPCGA
jgi:hypothetical protein